MDTEERPPVRRVHALLARHRYQREPRHRYREQLVDRTRLQFLPTGDIDESAYINTANADQINVDPGLVADAMSKTAPNFKPMATSSALAGGATPPNDGFFDVSATFIGAVGDDDWTTGWTAYPQN